MAIVKYGEEYIRTYEYLLVLNDPPWGTKHGERNFSEGECQEKPGFQGLFLAHSTYPGADWAQLIQERGKPGQNHSSLLF